MIYHPEKHVYVFHVDVKSDPLLIHWIHNYCTGDNCFHIEPRNVAWAGLTTGEMMLALMHEALEAGESWEHFVLIGHESVPITTLEYAEAYIGAFPLDTNFIHCMNVGGYDFFGQWENAYSRLEQVVVDSFSGRLFEGLNIKRSVPWSDSITFYKSIQLVVLSREFVRCG